MERGLVGMGGGMGGLRNGGVGKGREEEVCRSRWREERWMGKKWNKNR